MYYGKGTGGAGGSATSVEAIGWFWCISCAKWHSNCYWQQDLSGTVALGSSATASTPSSGDDSTKVATTAYVQG